jgi:dihydroflavonol-4-reductase
MNGRDVLVTGGTGFLGTTLVPVLARAGWSVHVLARARADRSAIAAHAASFHAVDLCEDASVGRAFDAVRREVGERPLHAVHSAALISYRSRDRELLRRVNVGGTQLVLAAARRTGIERLVHVSSVVAVGSARPGEVLDEDSPNDLAGCGVGYVETKRAAEDLVLAEARALDVVVVNPSGIFGPVGRESNTARFLRALQRGTLGPLAPPGGMDVVGVGDVARGIVLALERGARGRRYILTESHYSHLALFRLAARVLGVRGPLAACPASLWPAILSGARFIDRIVPLETTPPEALAMLGRTMRFSSSRARAELGWRPAPFREVLRETIDHLVATGWLRAVRSARSSSEGA